MIAYSTGAADSLRDFAAAPDLRTSMPCPAKNGQVIAAGRCVTDSATCGLASMCPFAAVARAELASIKADPVRLRVVHNPRRCAVCPRMFRPYRASQLACSQKCGSKRARAAAPASQARVCRSEACLREFIPGESRALYCNRKCAAAQNNLNRARAGTHKGGSFGWKGS